jgi:hypothetical protein
VRATFVQLHAKRGEFFERGVLAVFRGLSWDYKTNRPQAFGRRIVVKHVLDAWGSPDHHATDRLDDLERAMHLLAGRREPDHGVSVNSRLWDAPLLDAAPSSLRHREGGDGASRDGREDGGCYQAARGPNSS